MSTENLENAEKVVVISQSDFEQLKSLKEKEAKRLAKEKRKEDLRTLDEIEDEVVRDITPVLLNVEGILKSQKERVYEKCKEYIDLRNEMYPNRINSSSITLMSKDKDKKIQLKTNRVKRYTENSVVGVNMIKDYVQSLIKEDDSSNKDIVELVLSFLRTDAAGNLQEKLLLDLRKWALEKNNDIILEALEIIDSASYIQETSTAIYFFIKDSVKGGMRPVSLGMTEDIK
jgi:hypothetical protein